jgi:hypothetical protein
MGEHSTLCPHVFSPEDECRGQLLTSSAAYSSSWTTSIFPDLTAVFKAAWSRSVWSA